MRPTLKQYNDAINAADNWRRNYDVEREAADLWYQKYLQAVKAGPVLVVIGVMLGVLGVLLAIQAFNVN